MKSRSGILLSLTVILLALPVRAAETWYVRHDGGTRYSARTHSGQCDGQADAAYPGKGSNRHCAFNDVRYLWTDGSYATSTNSFPGWGWIGSGGDTYVIEGGPWRIGQSGPNPGDYLGLAGDPYSAGAPPPPSGTAAQHTRILGACAFGTYSCTAVNTYPLPSNNLTQLFGGYGVGAVLNLAGSHDVDIEGIEITAHNGRCSRLGTPPYPAGCNTSYPLSDYASSGIETNNTTANITLQDVYIHGLSESGLVGPIGGPFTMTRVFVGFNAFAGWNFDSGNKPDASGASIRASYVTMEGNGCNEEYPIVHKQFPALSCYDSEDGGFGDSWSGQDTPLSSFICDHCVMAYNTKDGFIGPHTVIEHLSITNSESYGNMGQQWKWSTAPGSTTIFENNLTVGNCRRMSAQLTGASPDYNRHLGGFCRAAGDVFAFYSGPNSTVLFANNTTIGYSATLFDLGCQTPSECGSTRFIFRDNIVLGFLNHQYNPGNAEVPGLFYYSDSSVKVNPDHDIFYNLRSKPCPWVGKSDLICENPAFVNEPALTLSSESQLDSFNFHPNRSSPAIAHGQSVNELTTDFFGKVRPNPPTIGGVEP